MYSLSVKNKYGDELQLTGNKNYICTVTGLSPVTSNIVTAPVANYGGERYVSSRQQKRNIVLNIYVNEPVETNRINLYKYFKSDDWIRVYYKNNTRDVYIDGYVESFELDHFAQTQTAQISIICPHPQLIDAVEENKIISVSNPNFYFPFYSVPESDEIVFSIYSDGTTLINNRSDDEVGFIYKIQCNGTVINPVVYDEDAHTHFKVNGIYYRDSVIIIDTRNGKKSLSREWRGTADNIINKLDPTSTWIQLKAGYNHIVQSADTGAESMVSQLIYSNEYEGV